MSVALLFRVMIRWETLLVAGIVMILIPLVSYLASLRPRLPRRRFLSPAEKALHEAPAQALE